MLLTDISPGWKRRYWFLVRAHTANFFYYTPVPHLTPNPSPRSGEGNDIIMKLHIITPFLKSRAENVGKIARYFMEEMEPHPFAVRWHIAIQGEEHDPYGMNKTNEMLDLIQGTPYPPYPATMPAGEERGSAEIAARVAFQTLHELGARKDDWIYTWADDTTHTPQLFRRLAEEITKNPWAEAVIFHTELANGWQDKTPPDIFYHGTQVCWRASMLRPPEDRFDFSHVGHTADVALYRRIWGRDQAKFHVVDEKLMRVNNLPSADWKKP